MKTLTGSSCHIFSCKYREKMDRGIWRCSEYLAPTRRENLCFHQHQKNVNVNFSLSVSLQPKAIYPVVAVSPFSLSDTQTLDENEGGSEIKYESYGDTDKNKTVHARFKLQKECEFGQQLLIVGDDPIFGLWDPSEAIPLNWSEGHVWNTELDIPSGKLLKYKFIMKGDTETVMWQPGPDRVLETWETEKTKTVIEDWDDPKLQNIIEEELNTDQKEWPSLSSDSLIVAEHSTQLQATEEITTEEEKGIPSVAPDSILMPTSRLEVEASVNEMEEMSLVHPSDDLAY